jgi:hypothetical protein
LQQNKKTNIDFIVICSILGSCDILNAELTLRIHVSGTGPKTYIFNVDCETSPNGSDPIILKVIKAEGVAQQETKSNVTPARSGNNTYYKILQ